MNCNGYVYKGKFRWKKQANLGVAEPGKFSIFAQLLSGGLTLLCKIIAHPDQAERDPVLEQKVSERPCVVNNRVSRAPDGPMATT